MIPCRGKWVGVLIGGTRLVVVTQVLLIRREGSQVTIPLFLGGSPGVPLMDMFILVPGMLISGPVPRTGSVIGRLWLTLSMIPAEARPDPSCRRTCT